MNNVEYIRKLDVKAMQSKVLGDYPDTIDKEYLYIVSGKTPCYLPNRNELYNFIFHLDLKKFLGIVSQHHTCIFCHQNTGDINIDEHGQQFYKCHNKDCNFYGTILRVIERLSHCDNVQSIQFIKNVYRIEIAESEWQKQQKEILQANKEYLESGKMKVEFPELHKRIIKYIPLLIILHDIAMNNVYDEPLSNTNNIIFYTSIRYIASLLNYKGLSKISERINLFCFLDLLQKLNLHQIPKKMLHRSSELKSDKNHKLISYYSIPSYCDDVLNDAERQAILFKAKNMSMTGWSRELLVRTFGNDIANKIYTQDTKYKSLPESSDNFTVQIALTILNLIQEHGYATEKQCIQLFYGNKRLIESKIKRVLEEILESYNLKRIRCNKMIKEKLHIDIKGYPYIIVNAA